jgi:hypothetical protein
MSHKEPLRVTRTRLYNLVLLYKSQRQFPVVCLFCRGEIEKRGTDLYLRTRNPILPGDGHGRKLILAGRICPKCLSAILRSELHHRMIKNAPKS